MRESTTITTRIRNRNSVLKQSLYNWLRYDVPIAILDWRDEGCESAWDVVKDVPAPERRRIRLVETKYEYRWHHTACWNLSISLADTEHVLVVDVDHLLHPDLWDCACPLPCEFAYPHFPYLFGLCWMRKRQWEKVNGYNENLMWYGADDTEFYNRLKAVGYKVRAIPEHLVEHIDHSVMSRLAPLLPNQPTPSAACSELFQMGIEMQKLSARCLPWTAASKRIKWGLEQIDENRWLATRQFT